MEKAAQAQRAASDQRDSAARAVDEPPSFFQRFDWRWMVGIAAVVLAFIGIVVVKPMLAVNSTAPNHVIGAVDEPDDLPMGNAPIVGNETADRVPAVDEPFDDGVDDPDGQDDPAVGGIVPDDGSDERVPDAPGGSDAPAVNVPVAENGLVTLRLPREIIGRMSEAEAQAYVDSNGFESGVLTDEGVLVVRMSEELFLTLMQRTEMGLSDTIANYIAGGFDNGIVDITHDDARTKFTVEVSSMDEDNMKAIAADILAWAELYDLYHGQTVIHPTVEFRDGSGTLLKTLYRSSGYVGEQ